MTPRDDLGPGADEESHNVEEAVETARDSTAFGVLLQVGLMTYGVLHLLIAGIAFRLAWVGSSGAATEKPGALQQLASTVPGPVVLGAVAIGLGALVLWRLGLAVWGHSWQLGWIRRTGKRVGAACQAVVYAVLCVQAGKLAIFGDSGSGRRSAEDSLSLRLLDQPFGRLLLLAVAAVIIGIGGYLCVKGIARRFTIDLIDNGTPVLNRIGQLGFTAKGIALASVGVLFGWAALTQDANKAGGLDAALHTIRQQPFGAVLLAVVGIGMVAFGLYCFGWSRRARRS